MIRRFVGLDLAWSARNPSGGAVIDERGRVLDVRGDLGSDGEIVAWTRAHVATPCAIGIDMPTIVRNPAGMRTCERDLAAAFRAAHAGPHPANLRRFPDGGRGRRIIDALGADGVVERLDIGPRARGRFAFEVYPHPAAVRLFGLDRIFEYKKKPRRTWTAVRDAWRRYRAALASLASASPPLVLDGALPDALGDGVVGASYKSLEDRLDAIMCAYVAAYVWERGTGGDDVRVFGDLESGYIVVPWRRIDA